MYNNMVCYQFYFIVGKSSLNKLTIVIMHYCDIYQANYRDSDSTTIAQAAVVLDRQHSDEKDKHSLSQSHTQMK